MALTSPNINLQDIACLGNESLSIMNNTKETARESRNYSQIFPPQKIKKQGTDNLKAIISIKQEQKKNSTRTQDNRRS